MHVTVALARASENQRKAKNAANEPVNNDVLQRMLNARDDNGEPLTEMMLLVREAF